MLVMPGAGLNAPAVFNGGGAGFPAPFVVPGNPEGALWYDSIANQLRGQAGATGSYNDKMEALFGVAASQGVQRCATGGEILLKSVRDAAAPSNRYLIDDSADPNDPDTWVRSADYDAVIANNTAPNENSDYATLLSGVNDSNPNGGNTRLKHFRALSKLREFIKEDQPNTQFFTVPVLHRILGSANPSDLRCQATREGQLDFIAAFPDVFFGGWHGDLALVDAAHFTTSVYQNALADRLTRIVANICKIPLSGGIYGAQTISAVWEETGSILCTLAHEAGTDITVTSGCEDMFGLDVGGTIYQPSSVEKVSATQYRLHFDGVPFTVASINELKVVYGAMGDLDQTNPETINDNSPQALPIRPALITPTVESAIDALGFDLDLWPKFSTRTLSGSDLTALTDRLGNNYVSAAGYYPTYDSENGGALVSQDTQTYIRTSDAVTHDTDGMYNALVFTLPETLDDNAYLLAWGTSAIASVQDYFSYFVATDGTLRTRTPSGYVILSGDLRGQTNVVIIEHIDQTTINFYINETEITISIDPYDLLGVGSMQYAWFLGSSGSETDSSTGVKLHRALIRLGTYDSENDATSPSELAALLTDLYV